MRLNIQNQISSIVARCLGLLLTLTIATQAVAGPTTVTSKPTLSGASSFTNPGASGFKSPGTPNVNNACALTPPVLSPTSVTVVQGAAAVNITANGCPGGIIQYFNNFGNPAGVYTIAPGGTISVPTNLPGVMVISTLCSANGCISDVSSATVTINASTPTNASPFVANTIPTQTETVGSNLVFVVPSNTFSDPNNDPLTITASGLPSGLFFNGSVLSGPLLAVGSSTITLTAKNTRNLSVSTSFVLSVVAGTPAVNQPPTVVGGGIPAQSGTQGTALSIPTAYAFSDPENGPLTFSAGGLPPDLTINPTTGIISGTPAVYGSYGVTILVTDDGGLSTNTGFLLTVGLNPAINYPVIVGNVLNSPTVVIRAPLTIPTAYGFKDPEGRALTFISSPLPAGLALNPNTGVITGTPTTYGEFGITIGAMDDGGSSVFNGFFLTINLNPSINEPPVAGSLPARSILAGDGVNIPTSIGFVDPEGGPLTYISSPLPAGLSLNPSTGVITGAATTKGSYGITIGATDNAGQTAYVGFPLTVTLDPAINYPPIVYGTGPAPQSGMKGVALSINTATAFNDPEERPLTFISSPLPGGLTLNPATGVISGVPTVYGNFGITIGARDDANQIVYGGFPLTISLNPAINEPPVVGTIPPQTGTTGVGLSIATAGAFSDPEGGALNYISSPLPGGLNLNPSTGVISGTPNQVGKFGITIGATDNGGNTVYTGFFLTISAPGGRVGVSVEPGTELAVTVFGNPVAGETVEIEISGAAGQAVSIQTVDGSGRSISKSSISQAGTTERTTVRLGQLPGMYLLQVNTPSQQKVVKILKQ